MLPPTHEQIHDASEGHESIKRVMVGSVLIAREVLQDPNFEATVVLICAHGSDGSYGLVLNRTSHMPLSEIFDGLASLPLSREILIGGPVQQHEMQVIALTSAPVPEAYEITPGIYLGGKWSDMMQMINSDPATTRIFLGYSGWGPGQLESEISIGAWDVYTVDIKQLLLNCHHLVGADTLAILSFLRSISF